MICQSCRDRHHVECKGGTWCDCQHEGGQPTSTMRDPRTPERITADELTALGQELNLDCAGQKGHSGPHRCWDY